MKVDKIEGVEAQRGGFSDVDNINYFIILL